MSKFEEIGCAKIAFDRADDSAQLNVNLADVGRNEIRAMRQAMNGQDQAGMLPHIDIDVDVDVDVNHKLAKAAHLIKALERRGFDVDIDKEDRSIEISKDFDKGFNRPLIPGRRAHLEFDREQGLTIELGPRHWGHEHHNRFGWRERAIINAVKDA